MKKSVIFRGPVLTQSGYGVHARQIAKWLLQRNDLDVKFIATPWGDTPWIINTDFCDGLIGKVMQKSISQESMNNFDVSLQLQLPNEWDPNLCKTNVGITASVETDRCNPEWVTACNAMHSVIVPSQHTKNNLTNTGNVTKKIHVIPESYTEAIDQIEVSQLPKFDTSFNFLIFGQLTGNNPLCDRKNIFFTIKWLCETFKDDPDVGIVIKTNTGKNSLIDRNLVISVLKQLLSEVRKGVGPKVYLLHGDMSDKDVASLYKHEQIKALVSLTRGEGFGLPILEAAASGLPVIATGWSGHLDFLNQGKFINVFYQLGEIHQARVDNKIFMKNSRWANPSEVDFKQKALKFRNSSSIPKQWAVELQQKIKNQYNFANICKMYDESLKEVL